MPQFQIVMPHEAGHCTEALEETRKHDPDFYSQVFYGCLAGDDTGYALIEAASEEEARNRIPSPLRTRARVVEVEHVTPEAMLAAHDRATQS